MVVDGLAGYLAVLHLSAGRVEHLEGVVSPRERTLEHSKTAQREQRVVCNVFVFVLFFGQRRGMLEINQSFFTSVDSNVVSDKNEIQSKNFKVLVNYINLLTGPRTISLATEVMASLKISLTLLQAVKSYPSLLIL